ncbi:MAG: hypothetical protein LBF34_04780 [Puniceicoccales bacterium]|nr:hypothetical protein [Puniceicoccales bacterium]
MEKYGPLGRKIGRAVAYMHSKGIVHEDFNTNNWLYNEQTGEFYLIDWECSRDLGEKCISQPILLSPAMSDIGRIFRLGLSVGLAHKFSQPSIALIKMFFLGVFNGQPWPNEFKSIIKECFKEGLAILIENNMDCIITCKDLDGAHGDIIEKVYLVQIFIASHYPSKGILPIDIIKKRAMGIARWKMEQRIELRQETEDLEKVEAEENEKMQKQIAGYEKVLTKTSPEKLRQLHDDANGAEALIDAIVDEILMP